MASITNLPYPKCRHLILINLISYCIVFVFTQPDSPIPSSEIVNRRKLRCMKNIFQGCISNTEKFSSLNTIRYNTRAQTDICTTILLPYNYLCLMTALQMPDDFLIYNLKCVCPYLSRDIRPDQLEHTLLRVPIALLMPEDKVSF